MTLPLMAPTARCALPAVVIETQQTITNRVRSKAQVVILTNGVENAAHVEIPTCSETAVIAVRGSGSSWFKKKPYRIEFQDTAGKDKKVGLLGLAPDADWILLAAYTDKTFMRDVLSYELWRQMGHWAPQWRYVEVFLRTNDSDSNIMTSNRPAIGPRDLLRDAAHGYLGLYVLVEKIKANKHRLNLRKLRTRDNNEPEISGGYIFKRDRPKTGQTGITTGLGIRLTLEEPKEREITDDQKRWLLEYLNESERTLFGHDFANPTNGYRKYFDAASFVDYHWMIEASKNVDGHWFSQFYHKDREGLLNAGPVWDSDMAFGNVRFLRSQETNGWRSEQVNGTYYAWYGRMFEDEEFLQRYVDRWAELRQTVFATTNVFTLIDALASSIRPAAVATIARWFPPPDDKDPDRVPNRRFEVEVRRMKDWIRDRLAWIDSQEYSRPEYRIERLPEGTAVSMTCKDGQLFFTTNSVDPRMTGGKVAPTAVEYSRPVDVSSRMTIMARTRSQFGLWSAPVLLKVEPTWRIP